MKRIILILLAVLWIGNANAQGKRSEQATFGMGCFWCTEAIFQKIKGVTSVKSGYEGGKIANPTYEEVCTGLTGHAEVLQITYNPMQISYTELLEIFWKSHDPTTLNRQGADSGTQYRSVIFYHNAEQKALADKYKNELNKTNAFGKKVVTAIEPAKPFYVAESYHQNYYKNNGDQAYCRLVILPKLEKLEKVFKSKLKN
ncbi:peptide-methionine (S)-S-oxide reductase MsrA [Pedobacter aquatilis]|uniref:peptide-methionine (S)-S-oxide reductase MsrA n=1 Tax=Pedobacter aquatilis TaxID=351343 RepID=UPI0025B527C9|nr:peptide-methionine (S)-S-oxide reductase MsrA [Pedobacter aquatilis]MDN3585197.1 peptide-methionine (S)-S-oxide reductase MsrA [Pedobacter aquatilis]